MTPNQLAAYVPVIRAIEQASGKELRAIARVEHAIKSNMGLVSQSPGPEIKDQPKKTNIYNPRKAQRQKFNQGSEVESIDSANSLVSVVVAQKSMAGSSDTAGIIEQQVAQNNGRDTHDALTKLTQAITDLKPSISNLSSATVDSTSNQPPAAISVDVVNAIKTQSEKQAGAEKKTRDVIEGMYQDEKGRWRQENGAFATRRQKEIVTGKSSGTDDSQQSGFSKILNWAKGRFMEDRQEDAVDAAGVAVGGSVFLATKEMYQLAQSAEDMVSRVRRRGNASDESIDGTPQPALGASQRLQDRFNKPALRRQAVDFAFSLFRNPKRAVMSLFQRAARGDLDNKAATMGTGPAGGRAPTSPTMWEKTKGWFTGKPVGATAQTGASAAGKQNTQTYDSKAIYSVNQSVSKGAKTTTSMSAAELSRTDRQSDLMRDAIEDQTTALTLAINETTEAIKDLKLNVNTGPGLLDMVGDFFGRGRRNRGGRGGRRPTWRERIGGWGSDNRQPANSRRAPGRMGSYSGMGTGPAGGRAPTSPTMWEKTKGWFTGKPVGATAQTGASAAGAAGGAAGGKFAGAMRMGGTILSRLALPLTAVVAAFEGFKGFTDAEGQKRAFNLKDGEEASLGQKSAMAAGQVLSAGGLTELLFGVSGDDIARTLYEFFGGSPRAQTLAPYQPVQAGAFSSAGMAAATKTAGTQAQTVSKSPMVMANTTPAQNNHGVAKPATEDGKASPAAPLSKSPGSMLYAPAAVPPAPPAPAPAPVKADQKPTVVVAQLDQKSLKALSDANKPAPAPAQQSTTNNVENIRMQTKSPGQVPLAASDQLMHLQSLDRM